MKKSEILNLVANISDKFHRINKEENIEMQCEVLHSALLEVYRDFTEKDYNNLSLTFRKTLEKLDKAIFQHVSMDYKQIVENAYKESSIFAKELPKQDIKINTKVKTTIGFIKEGTEI